MHIVSLSCDDGFLKSVHRIAEIYEAHGQRACFNVIATGHLDSFITPDSGQAGFPKGDFDLWNELQHRGHEIMPHGYRHARKPELPFAEAQRLITDCLAVFSAELDGFRPEAAVFNFPYNKSTPELETWLPSVVKAFRTAGGGINPVPHPGQVKLTTTGWGPGNCEHDLEAEIEKLLSGPSGWLIYNTHGLDDEGWGPIGADYLDRLLDRLLSISTVRILPTGQALRLADE
ncbi:polysaccharide deacetylase family protein [bacterium]|nr:polysaccharide deacetylase family protein [bacterium]